MAPRKGSVPHNKGKRKQPEQPTIQQPQQLHAVLPVTPVLPLPAADAGAEVSLSALQQVEEKRKQLYVQLKDVERQVIACTSVLCYVHIQFKLACCYQHTLLRAHSVQIFSCNQADMGPCLYIGLSLATFQSCLSLVQIFDLETRYLQGCNPQANALIGMCFEQAYAIFTCR